MGQRGEVFTWRFHSARETRTYFLNVKENRTGDLYLALVESKKHGETDFERHQVVIFEEDFEEFEKGMTRVLEFLGARRRRPVKGQFAGGQPRRAPADTPSVVRPAAAQPAPKSPTGTLRQAKPKT